MRDLLRDVLSLRPGVYLETWYLQGCAFYLVGISHTRFQPLLLIWIASGQARQASSRWQSETLQLFQGFGGMHKAIESVRLGYCSHCLMFVFQKIVQRKSCRS